MKKYLACTLLAALCSILTACTVSVTIKPSGQTGDTVSEAVSKTVSESETTHNSAISTSALTDALLSLFEKATGYGASAGSSLRNLLNAEEYLTFAEEIDYSHIDAETRSEAASAAFVAMEAEEQAFFLYNFSSIQRNVENMFENLTSMEGSFENVGISLDSIAALTERENAREQWDALSADIEALGNLADYADIAEGLFLIDEP